MAVGVDIELRQEILNRFEFISYFFNPDALRREVTIQFRVTDDRLEGGEVCFYFQTTAGRCEIFEGRASRWDTSITVSYAYWLRLQGRQLGKARILADLIWSSDLRVRGNPLLFFSFDTIFGGTLNEEHLRPTDLDERSAVAIADGPRWHVPRKVVILSGSGRSRRHATSYHFASLLAEGMAQAEPPPHVELLHLRELDYEPCTGCFSCWRRGGACVLRDDYSAVIEPMLDDCDLLVLAFPLYFYDFPPNIRKVITRFFARGHPFLRWNDGAQTLVHYNRRALRCSMFLLGVSALPDMEQFEIPLKQIELLTRQTEVEFLGALFRTMSNSFLVRAARTPQLDAIEDAFLRAGRELAETGTISQETREIAEQWFRTPAQLRAGAYAYYHFINRRFKFPLTALRSEVSRYDVTSPAPVSDTEDDDPESTPDAA